MLKISLLCCDCYERSRIRNTCTSVTLDHLADIRWKCGHCEEWHTGPCLDFGYDAPFYWSKENESENRRARLLPNWGKEEDRKTFLDRNYCAIEGQYFFVRGKIHLPIVGSAQTFRWGVWVRLAALILKHW